ncbi:1-acyl-sn-glycerol-3-phosphate acyltransferase [Streptomyces sp. RerS4]|uniref:1-acyl-sn-glycerol-3-phosphate acyltransferase n=1 Tax=Streptomyces sp. RerS4 TaxID=2942449 RepID=UPI00201BEA1E|nr:1-acyl-sn-glycerol-3-phosphate acyltransferase [Streptomyces sp. RerS4]UQX03994.1 1-acyl-sn-glycerol-3-phosphate acyltransferase [Streptomyces sp. RerS4]
MSEIFTEMIEVAGGELRYAKRLLVEGGEVAWRRWLDWLIDDYFRLDVLGLENIPTEGAGVVVANHSGAWALDAFVLHRVLVRRLDRRVKVLAAPLVFRMPVAGSYARKTMSVVPIDPLMGLEHLKAGELVGVFPEGMSGLEKPFHERYRLRPFSPGYAVAALRAGAPVIPVAVIGAEESCPRLGEVPAIARMFGLPFFPVTPPFPLPAKWVIAVGEPIPAPERPRAFAERHAVSARFNERVQAAVQELVDREREKRDTLFA